jgi:hypothetical protein
MAIPNNEYFSFSDVCYEIYGRPAAAGDNLAQLISDADSYGGTWDPAYVGSKNNLLSFRNFQKLTFSRSPVRMDFDINGGTQWGSVTSNYPQLYFTGLGWCQVSPTSSTNGSETLTITCDYNNEGVDRSGMIYINDGNSNTIDAIYIYQTAY